MKKIVTCILLFFLLGKEIFSSSLNDIKNQENAIEKELIVTTVAPIAALIKMITLEEFDIITIKNKNSCIHHAKLIPSDLEKINKASLVIYINENFESFLNKILHNLPKNKKLSLTDDLNLTNEKMQLKSIKYPDLPANWHIWLKIENAKIILEKISIKLSNIYPEKSLFFKKNLVKAKLELDLLSKKIAIITKNESKKTYWLLNSDFISFMESNNLNYTKGNIHFLLKKIESSNDKKIDDISCIISTHTNQKTASFIEENYHRKKYSNIDIEDCSYDNYNSYIIYMNKILDQLVNCR